MEYLVGIVSDGFGAVPDPLFKLISDLADGSSSDDHYCSNTFGPGTS